MYKPAAIAVVTAAVILIPTRAGLAQMPDMPAGTPMERMGSGTSWLPDAAAQPARMFTAGAWSVMVHGAAFAQYDRQAGQRGADQLGILNWAMVAAGREVAGGRFQARTMLSLDALTVGGSGYPLLLQSGETWRGVPLHDRQHPHDFISELGAMYERPLVGPLGASLYAAASGEPALGPVAFMHRASALDIPTAPLGHHWQDATHVSFGVLTAGLFTRHWKLEGSRFNGREPDEERWGLDPIRLDSYAGRVTWNPNAHWSVATGYGYLADPEPAHPGESIHRETASLQHATSTGTSGQWATTVIWGANASSATRAWRTSVLLESEAVLDPRNAVFGRAESVEKSAGDLVVDGPPFGFAPDRAFTVSALTLGYVREVGARGGLTTGIGLAGTVNVVPAALDPAYGSRTPVGAVVFLRIRPARSAAHTMDHMRMPDMRRSGRG